MRRLPVLAGLLLVAVGCSEQTVAPAPTAAPAATTEALPSPVPTPADKLNQILKNAQTCIKQKRLEDFWDKNDDVQGMEAQVQPTNLGAIPYIGRIVITLKSKGTSRSSPAGSLRVAFIYYTYANERWHAEYGDRANVGYLERSWGLKEATNKQVGRNDADAMAKSPYYSCFLP